MMVRKLLLLVVSVTFSFNALAGPQSGEVKGYKEYKFGISEKKFKAMKPCTLVVVPIETAGIPGFICSNFLFGKDKTFAAFAFINGKLSNISIQIPEHKQIAILDSLTEKYGKPSTRLSEEEIKNIENPDTETNMFFAKDTVNLKYLTDKDNKLTVVVSYRVKNYNEMVDNLQKIMVKDDL